MPKRQTAPHPPPGASGQSSHTHAQLPILIDGKTSPEQIPDEIAYRHFIMLVAEHRDASPEDIRRRDSRLLPMQLSKRDHDTLILALAGVREDLDLIDHQRAKVSGGDAASDTLLASLKDREKSLLLDAWDHLRGTLTTDGSARLDSYIREHVKRRIVVYGSN